MNASNDIKPEFERNELEMFESLLTRMEQLNCELENLLGGLKDLVMDDVESLKCGSDKCRGGHEWVGEGELARLNIINCGVDIWRSDIELTTANLSLFESLKRLKGEVEL